MWHEDAEPHDPSNFVSLSKCCMQTRWALRASRRPRVARLKSVRAEAPDEVRFLDLSGNPWPVSKEQVPVAQFRVVSAERLRCAGSDAQVAA